MASSRDYIGVNFEKIIHSLKQFFEKIEENLTKWVLLIMRVPLQDR